MQIMLDGKNYTVVNQLRPDRAIIDYDGLFVLADLTGGSWDLSGVPASPDEEKILKDLCAPTNDKTIVTVNKK